MAYQSHALKIPLKSYWTIVKIHRKCLSLRTKNIKNNNGRKIGTHFFKKDEQTEERERIDLRKLRERLRSGPLMRRERAHPESQQAPLWWPQKPRARELWSCLQGRRISRSILFFIYLRPTPPPSKTEHRKVILLRNCTGRACFIFPQFVG